MLNPVCFLRHLSHTELSQIASEGKMSVNHGLDRAVCLHAKCLHVGPGPTRRVPFVGLILKDHSLY